jgi:hypothetical protein
MSSINKPEQIDMYRQRVLLKGLKLELIGMKLSRGRSCYSIVKQEYGLKGNKQSVYDQFKAISDAAFEEMVK